jgi:hypothetical protein
MLYQEKSGNPDDVYPQLLLVRAVNVMLNGYFTEKPDPPYEN